MTHPPIDARTVSFIRQRRAFPRHKSARTMQAHEVASDVRLDGLARDAMQAFVRGSHLYRHGGSPNCSCAHGTLRPQRDASATRLSRNIAPTRRQTARVMTTFEQHLPSVKLGLGIISLLRCT